MSTPVQTAVGAFVWHDHQSTDPETARRFYEDLFAWKIEVWKPGEMDYPMITVDDQMHGGFNPAHAGASSWLGHVLVDDVDETVERAKTAGGSVLTGPMDIPEVGRFAVVQDPQGAVVSAYAFATEFTPPQGVFVWDELYADDVEEEKRFYAEVFGWTSSEMDMGGGQTYTMFSSGDQQRAGAMTKPASMQAPPHWLVYISSDDVDADAAKAKELGAQIYMEPFDVSTVGRSAILADPTGAAFGLFKAEQ